MHKTDLLQGPLLCFDRASHKGLARYGLVYCYTSNELEDQSSARTKEQAQSVGCFSSSNKKGQV